MQITVNGQKVRRWREERCWSQEHLSKAAGVSMRTIQRIENGDPAARETVMALAAAFGVDVAALVVDIDGEIRKSNALEAERKNAQFWLSFWIHLATYIFVIALLLTLNLYKKPDDLWVLWPAIGWGIGVAAHGLAAFITGRVAQTEAKLRSLD